jgi:hypothetical protein
MGRIVLFVVIGAVIVGLWARSALIEKSKADRKRKEEEPSELNKHPERLEQNLDPTDDA